LKIFFTVYRASVRQQDSRPSLYELFTF